MAESNRSTTCLHTRISDRSPSRIKPPVAAGIFKARCHLAFATPPARACISLAFISDVTLRSVALLAISAKAGNRFTICRREQHLSHSESYSSVLRHWALNQQGHAFKRDWGILPQ